MLLLRAYGRPESLAALGRELEDAGEARGLVWRALVTLAPGLVVASLAARAIAVLAVNVLMISVGGSLTLTVQRLFARRRVTRIG